MKKRIKDFCDFFELNFPIIQAGMIWVSGSKLASACANEGIMGTIGAGSMKPDTLEHHLKQALELTKKENRNKLAINLPLLYHGIEEQIELAIKYEIRNFITSAGSPKKFTSFLKDKGKKVIHVTSSSELAKKCEVAKVDAVIAEGFEAGGHNGRNETTTIVLIPQVVDTLSIPVIAAGGIADSRQIHAAHALGASGVQVGSRFIMAKESSAHHNFQQAIMKAKEGETKLLLKEVVPVRLLNNEFSRQIQELQSQGASQDAFIKLLGKGRAKKGIFDGDLREGELEVGQVSSTLNTIQSAKEIIQDLASFYK